MNFSIIKRILWHELHLVRKISIQLNTYTIGGEDEN